jgi:hypothetical protein
MVVFRVSLRYHDDHEKNREKILEILEISLANDEKKISRLTSPKKCEVTPSTPKTLEILLIITKNKK